LRVALLVSLGGAVLTVVGIGQGLVGDAPAAGFSSGLLLWVLAFAPTVAALLFVLTGRALVGAGVLVGAALLAPGLALVDAQFLADALQASRPEILVPTSLADLTPGAGIYLVLAGHVAAAVAGGLAAGRAGAGAGSGPAGDEAAAEGGGAGAGSGAGGASCAGGCGAGAGKRWARPSSRRA